MDIVPTKIGSATHFWVAIHHWRITAIRPLNLCHVNMKLLNSSSLACEFYSDRVQVLRWKQYLRCQNGTKIMTRTLVLSPIGTCFIVKLQYCYWKIWFKLYFCHNCNWSVSSGNTHLSVCLMVSSSPQVRVTKSQVIIPWQIVANTKVY